MHVRTHEQKAKETVTNVRLWLAREDIQVATVSVAWQFVRKHGKLATGCRARSC